MVRVWQSVRLLFRTTNVEVAVCMRLCIHVPNLTYQVLSDKLRHAWRTPDQESEMVLLPKKWVKTLLSSSPRVPVGTPTGTWDVAASERTGGSD